MALRNLKSDSSNPALKKPAKPLQTSAKKKAVEAPLVASSLQLYDVPLVDIRLSDDNPNEQDEKTFDTLVERIRVEGFDEPVHIMPDETKRAKYVMVSGEHRFKAAKTLGMQTIPALIHKDWTDQKRKIELVARNQLRGAMNPEKFTQLFNSIMKTGSDKELVKIQMGFTKSDAFNRVYKQISNTLPAKDKKKLEDMKETIKSVDDLSSILNTIFKDHGSELDKGFMVFSFGGKEHHYFQTDKELNIMIKAVEAKIEKEGITAAEFFKRLLSKA